MLVSTSISPTRTIRGVATLTETTRADSIEGVPIESIRRLMRRMQLAIQTVHVLPREPLRPLRRSATMVISVSRASRTTRCKRLP